MLLDMIDYYFNNCLLETKFLICLTYLSISALNYAKFHMIGNIHIHLYDLFPIKIIKRKLLLEYYYLKEFICYLFIKALLYHMATNQNISIIISSQKHFSESSQAFVERYMVKFLYCSYYKRYILTRWKDINN